MVAATTVLVVGAGPTGLLLGAELCRRGVACRVIDAHPAPLPWDRATVLHPRSLEIFESLGLVDSVLAQGVKQHKARLHSAGTVLGEIDLSLCGSRYKFNIGVSEEVVESILTRYLNRLGGAVIPSSLLVALAEHEDSVLATIEHDGATEQLSARWVVGCDGYASTTRTCAGIELRGHDIAEPWAVFDATLTGWPNTYEGAFAYLDEMPVILTSLPQQRWRVYLRPNSSDQDLVAEASATISRYLPLVRFDDVASPTRFHCHSKVAERFRSGRIMLAGDAAHVCTPAQGHGMNAGLQDAFNLAWKLALVVQGRAAPVLLDSYEVERRKVAEMIAASGDAAEQAQTLTDPAERRARDRAIRAVFAEPASRHHEAVAEAELDIDYAHSPIVMGAPNPALAPGQRLPDTIEIALPGGGAGMLHELTSRPGHTALVIGGTNADDDSLVRLDADLRRRDDMFLIEKVVVLTVRGEHPSAHAGLAPDDADRLGVSGITLLVVRPDGHIGLRADRDHLDALAAYQARLVSGSR